MPRKLRLEFPGACYHVINRGNYRMPIFQSEGAKSAFEACLFEACVKSEWLLHAFILMSNHFHLALETPAGNLVAGMHWLQTTFATRFNRLRDERGHLFQGRYKALLVEPLGAMAEVCHYIHLNPVCAGLLPIEQLAAYRHSSYWFLGQPTHRPPCLVLGPTLEAAGRLADQPAGWQAYAQFLAWHLGVQTEGRLDPGDALSKGWAVGTPEFKAMLIKEHAVAAETRAWEKAGAQEIREHKWEALLARSLQALGKTAEAVRTERKSSPWKAAIAAHLKRCSQANNRWLADRLNMGRAEAVSCYVARLRRAGLETSEYQGLTTIV